MTAEIQPNGTPSNTNTTAQLPSDSTNTYTDIPRTELPPAAIALATRLFNWARSGETHTLQFYLDSVPPGSNLPNLTNGSGDTLIMLASYHGHPTTVSALLKAGADPNILNDRGQSCIAGAIFKGHDKVVKVLFEGGADIMAGHPNAGDCCRMFKKKELLKLFGVDNQEDGRMESGDVNMNGAS